MMPSSQLGAARVRQRARSSHLVFSARGAVGVHGVDEVPRLLLVTVPSPMFVSEARHQPLRDLGVFVEAVDEVVEERHAILVLALVVVEVLSRSSC